MITITKVGEPEDKYKDGAKLYEVKVDNKSLFAFIHNEDDKLSTCLARAANACSQYEMISEAVGKNGRNKKDRP